MAFREYDDDEMPEEEYEEPNNAGYKSSSRMRSLLSKGASNVTNNQTNLACLSKQKQNLGSRISLDIDFLIDGQISSFCPDQPGGWLLTLIMLHKLTQSL